MEDLVGRAVKKAFPGFGVYDGTVESYDAEAGYFRVLYEDGDSEEVDAAEMSAILVGPPMLSRTEAPGGYAGRRPKKRRRGDEESLEGSVLVAVEVADADGLSTPGERRQNGEIGDEMMVETVEKKRRVDPGLETARPVRRSARQAKAAALAAEMEAAVAVAVAAEFEAAAALAPVSTAARAQQSMRKRQRANGSGRYRSVSKDLEDAALDRLSPKPELPPSSHGLDLEGLHLLDVFQVYSFLRSFSRQLFLSPFPLETFVAALRCTYVNPLLDWVHFALLRALKSHLEDLAHEGDPSAIHCIRNLNWELLDLATWPIYLAEYLLTRGSELRNGLKLTDLKLLNTEYYKQPAAVKLELLSLFCDAILDIEAIRSELGSRMSELDGNEEFCRSTGVRRKGRSSSVKGLANSYLLPEGSDDIEDGNSDECYLCGMDGNLLCCDGCPAAFHSKCVGVVEDLLPEGDWHCPECLVQKGDGSRNMAKLVRGAEILGIDPHGRLYFGTCSYLLVFESCHVDSPCHYYGQLDLHALVTVLVSCHPSYNSIGKVISSFWGIATEASNFNGRYENSKECSTSADETDCRQSPLKQLSEHCQDEIEKDGSCEQLDSGNVCASNSDQFNQNFTLRSAPISENANENTADEKLNQASQHNTPSVNNDSCNSQQDDVCLHTKGFSAENQKEPSSQKRVCDCCIHPDPTKYINYYSFGKIAASAAEELKHKLSEHEEGKKPGLDAVSLWLKTICKKYVNVFALTDQKLSAELLKEKCGWCNSCQISGGSDCIFRVTDGMLVENLETSAVSLWSEKNKECHIVLAMHNILSIEERLNGLLSGPWQNPQYSIHWRKTILNSSNVPSLKQPLLMLESNLRRVAFSAEWHKPADSVEVVGSASHILVRTSNKSSSYATPKKPGRKPSNGELKVDSRDVGIYWWRGGTLSCQVFHWKRLPQSLARKAARQAGRNKIPTISYPDGSQFTRRFKHIAWRAAVEMSQNASQLILQIKELELNIKWNEIFSTFYSAFATKETQKTARLFKKVIIRRKRIDGTSVEYLLDFGKRENIPPIVAKNGIKFEVPSSERNRYWLSEGHVPLSLLKSYEAKAVTRLLKKKDSNNLPKMMANFKPQKLKRSVFDDLLEKAKKLPKRLCGQCFKEVITSEAANCQYCEALFHRKHFKVPRGTVDALYVCNKCLPETVSSAKSPQKKVLSKKSSPKKKQKKQTQKIVTRQTQMVINLKKKASKKKGKRGRPRKNPLTVSKNQSLKIPDSQPSNEPKNEAAKRTSKRLYDKYMKGNSKISRNAASCQKKKRTSLHYSYWLDGLRWTQITDDEQARSFRKERIVFPSKDVEISEVSPICSLCTQCYSKDAIYICCQGCEGWFHGIIYSITMENVNDLIGFKCHGCRMRAPPVCPYAQTLATPNDHSDMEDGIDMSVEDEDHNCQKDLSNGLKELHDHTTEKELHDHRFDKQVGDHKSLEVLETHSDLEVLDSHSTKKELNFYERKKKELNDGNCLKKMESHNNMKELDSHSTEEGLGGHDNLNDGYNHLSKLGNHKSVENGSNQNSPEEPGNTEGNMFASGETQSLKELDNHNNLKDLDSHNIAKELHNHNSLDELQNHNSLKELDNHISLDKLESHNSLKSASTR